MELLGDFATEMLAGKGKIEEDRLPFTISISDISSNGDLQLLFSE